MSETLLHMEHFTARDQGNGGVGAGPRATTPRSPRFSSLRTGGTLPAPQLPKILGQEVLRRRGGQILRCLAGLARGTHPHPKGSSHV